MPRVSLDTVDVSVQDRAEFLVALRTAARLGEGATWLYAKLYPETAA